MISITEIILIVAGFAAIIVGYLIPAGKNIDENDKKLMKKEIRELVRNEVENQKETIENIVDDTVDNSLDRTERAMERISNEKLSAIGEYSDTVINDIHKNHDEVMFMYDMLNDKHKNLTSVVSEVTRKTDEAKQALRDAEATVRDAEATVRDAEATAKGAEATARDAQESATKAKQAVSYNNSFPNSRAILLDEDSDRLSGIRIPYTERTKAEIDAVTVKPVEERRDQAAGLERKVLARENKYVTENEIKDLNEISVEVISNEKASTLHVIGNNNTNKKVVQLSDAIKAQNPDKNMQEITANDAVSQNKQIIEMHKAGKSNMVIARELGLGIGEVKLVIDLSNKHRKVR